jgi:hypothetical protein
MVLFFNVFSDIRVYLLFKTLWSLLFFLCSSLISHAFSCDLTNLGGIGSTTLFDGLIVTFNALLDVLGHLRLR